MRRAGQGARVRERGPEAVYISGTNAQPIGRQSTSILGAVEGHVVAPTAVGGAHISCHERRLIVHQGTFPFAVVSFGYPLGASAVPCLRKHHRAQKQSIATSDEECLSHQLPYSSKHRLSMLYKNSWEVYHRKMPAPWYAFDIRTLICHARPQRTLQIYAGKRNASWLNMFRRR